MGPTPASSLPQKLFATGEVTTVSSIHLIDQSITATSYFCKRYWKRIQDKETVGPSATVPGIFVQYVVVASIEPRPAFAPESVVLQQERETLRRTADDDSQKIKQRQR